MRIHKTDNLKIEISVTASPSGDTEVRAKRISVKVGDSEPIDARISERLVKSQITDNAFVRHILNFLIKD